MNCCVGRGEKEEVWIMEHHSHLYIHIGAGSESFVLHLSARANGMRAAYNFRYLLDCGSIDVSKYTPVPFCHSMLPQRLGWDDLALHAQTA